MKIENQQLFFEIKSEDFIHAITDPNFRIETKIYAKAREEPIGFHKSAFSGNHKVADAKLILDRFSRNISAENVQTFNVYLTAITDDDSRSIQIRELNLAEKTYSEVHFWNGEK